MPELKELPRSDEIPFIVADVDGTLLTSKHVIHARTLHALQFLRRTIPDLPIVIATGKQASSVAEIRSLLDLSNFPASHLNGCVVYERQDKIHSQIGLDVETVLKITTEMENKGVGILYFPSPS